MKPCLVREENVIESTMTIVNEVTKPMTEVYVVFCQQQMVSILERCECNNEILFLA